MNFWHSPPSPGEVWVYITQLIAVIHCIPTTPSDRLWAPFGNSWFPRFLSLPTSYSIVPTPTRTSLPFWDIYFCQNLQIPITWSDFVRFRKFLILQLPLTPLFLFHLLSCHRASCSVICSNCCEVYLRGLSLLLPNPVITGLDLSQQAVFRA